MRWIAATAAATALVVVTGAAWLYTRSSDGDRFAPCRSAAVAGGAGAIGGPFTLVDKDGQTVTDKDVITKPSLVYFGYTFCPDVCPLDSARNAEAADLLADRGYDVTPVFITVDPARDTPQVVGDFAEAFGERTIGLTGSPEQVQAASQAYRTYYKKHDSDDDYYLVDHSTFTYLVLPESGFAEFFRRDTTPEQIADTAACFIDRA